MSAIGRLRQRVTFERRAITNVGGVGQESWDPIGPVRMAAEVVGVVGRQEAVIDGTVQTQTARAYSVRTRYRRDVTTEDRCVYHAPDGDRLLQILGVVNEIERGAWLLVDCLEVRA